MPERTRFSLSARAAVVAALVACSAFALAPAANASTIYPPTGSCTATPAAATPGSTVQFACQSGTFSNDEPVTITVTGENGAAADIGMVRFAITTATGTSQSTATGALAAVPITFPSNASGTYNIAAISSTSAGGTAPVSVSAAGDGLPVTGVDGTALAALLIGGGALVVLGGGIAVTSAIRRRRAD
jgi:hypothetical protein